MYIYIKNIFIKIVEHRLKLMLCCGTRKEKNYDIEIKKQTRFAVEDI